MLDEVTKGLYEKALANQKKRTYPCRTIDEINQTLAEKGDGFIEAMWCESEECEAKVKELTGVSSRCMPLEQKKISDVCVCCGKPATKLVYWGRAY